MQTAPSPRTTVRRIPQRARYDQQTVFAILDDALVCHLGFVHDGQPFVIPTTFARVGSSLYIHGAAASRTLQALGSGMPACVTVTLLDGLVLARSAFHHSMNYRSVVVLGSMTRVDDPPEVLAALRAIVDRMAPGRYADVRAPNDKELRATSVLRMGLDEASAKVRTGGPVDDEDDYAGARCWAGVIPLAMRPAPPVPDARLDAHVAFPAYLQARWR